MSYFKVLGFDKEPFSTSPDPEFFYLSKEHEIALTNILIDLRLKRGLCIILGDVGTGKTTLSRKLIQELKSRDDFIFNIVLDPSFDSEELFLTSLVRNFEISFTPSSHVFSVLALAAFAAVTCSPRAAGVNLALPAATPGPGAQEHGLRDGCRLDGSLARWAGEGGGRGFQAFPHSRAAVLMRTSRPVATFTAVQPPCAWARVIFTTWRFPLTFAKYRSPISTSLL